MAVTVRGQDLPPVYCRTRAELLDGLADMVSETSGNVLIAWDFPFGYPVSSGLGGGLAVADRLAGLVEDEESRKWNNRFQVADQLNAELGEGVGPFWGYMGKDPLKTLGPGKPDFPVRGVAEHRIVEEAIRTAKGTPGFISSVWQLSYSGCVGGQAIMGLAAIARLNRRFEDGRRIRMWPFDTDWDAALDGIVHAECWPSLFDFSGIDHPIRDARQVRATCDGITAADRTGKLAELLGRPSGLAPDELATVEQTEGWIMGFRTGA